MKVFLDACGIISKVIYKLFPGSLSPYYREARLDHYAFTDFFAFADLSNLNVISNLFYSKIPNVISNLFYSKSYC